VRAPCGGCGHAAAGGLSGFRAKPTR
jgi:hypothetical protein